MKDLIDRNKVHQYYSKTVSHVFLHFSAICQDFLMFFDCRSWLSFLSSRDFYKFDPSIWSVFSFCTPTKSDLNCDVTQRSLCVLTSKLLALNTARISIFFIIELTVLCALYINQLIAQLIQRVPRLSL